MPLLARASLNYRSISISTCAARKRASLGTRVFRIAVSAVLKKRERPDCSDVGDILGRIGEKFQFLRHCLSNARTC